MTRTKSSAPTTEADERRVAIYARISRDDEGQELGVARQLDDCRELVAANPGWAVVAELSDNSVSAFRREAKSKRLGYLKLLELVKSKQVDTIVCWELDRVFRLTVDLEEIIGLVETNPSLLVRPVRGAPYDLTTANGRAVARVLTAIATQESELKRERIRAAKAQHAKMGRVLGGGTRPFGFENDRTTIRESEAAVIRATADRILAGVSLRQVVRELQDSGVPTAGGRPWHTNTVRTMLTSGRIAGKSEHLGKVVGDAEWDAILDEETWLQVRALLLDPKRRLNAHSSLKTKLLTGIAVCGLCGEPLRSQPYGKTDKQPAHPGYSCRRNPASGMHGCGRVRHRGDWLDAFVTAAVLERLSDEAVVEKLVLAESADRADPDVDSVARQLRDIDSKLARAKQLAVDGLLDAADLREQKARLDAERHALNDQLRTRSAQAPVVRLQRGNSIRDNWAQATVDEQRAVVTWLIERVLVKKGVKGRNKPDPSRIEIEWR